MIRFSCLLIIFLSANVWGQSTQHGPYTVTILAENVYNIEDSNSSNPAGFQFDADGERVGMNNSSDMYLIVGLNSALLIDLSNDIKWDDSAQDSLLELVYERIGDKALSISATHVHADHLGMLAAFIGEASVTFWMSEAEFKELGIFPKDKTVYFKKDAVIDLGGEYVIQTRELPGHTLHSTLFFLSNQDMVFSGDAMGSGSGVWLFDYESFLTYSNSIDQLIIYLEDSKNNINLNDFTIYSAHSWQYGELEKLSMQYVYDMQTLIQKISIGSATTSALSTFIPFLDTNFHYGTATITWNQKAAERYKAGN